MRRMTVPARRSARWRSRAIVLQPSRSQDADHEADAENGGGDEAGETERRIAEHMGPAPACTMIDDAMTMAAMTTAKLRRLLERSISRTKKSRLRCTNCTCDRKS